MINEILGKSQSLKTEISSHPNSKNYQYYKGLSNSRFIQYSLADHDFVTHNCLRMARVSAYLAVKDPVITATPNVSLSTNLFLSRLPAESEPLGGSNRA